MKIAVIGSGVSGIGATWLLNEHSSHEVHLFEKQDYYGGHTHTVPFIRPGTSSGSVEVDTGFIVFNAVTYPNFLRFLQTRCPEIEIISSEMSFSVSRERGQYEWAGNSLLTIFAQRSNLLNPAQWRLIWDIIRFNANAKQLLREHEEKDPNSGLEEETICSYLDRHGYSQSFRNNYLLPMVGCIWSTPPDRAGLEFPVLTLIRFMHNHHLLQIIGRPQWLTIKGGSKLYVQSILSNLPSSQLHLSTAVTSVESATSSSGAQVQQLWTADGECLEFDHVLFATHADQAMEILDQGSNLTGQEKNILKDFKFSKNEAFLHADTTLMPRRRSTWSAWNFLAGSSISELFKRDKVSLTYWMNLLSSLPEDLHGPILVTLNPPFEPRPELTIGRWKYDHPLYSPEMVNSQKRLPEIQNKRGITFAGAWCGYGFHEDGFNSGVKAAMTLGAQPPYDPVSLERSAAPSWLENFTRLSINKADIVRKRFLLPPFQLLCVIGLIILAAIFIPVVLLILPLLFFPDTVMIPGSFLPSVLMGLFETNNLLQFLRVAWEDVAEFSVGEFLLGTHRRPIRQRGIQQGRQY